MKVTCELRSMNIVEKVSFKTEGYQIMNITEKIQELVVLHEFKKGLVNLSILHTSASLMVQENASKDVLDDIEDYGLKLISRDKGTAYHIPEGILLAYGINSQKFSFEDNQEINICDIKLKILEMFNVS